MVSTGQSVYKVGSWFYNGGSTHLYSSSLLSTSDLISFLRLLALLPDGVLLAWKIDSYIVNYHLSYTCIINPLSAMRLMLHARTVGLLSWGTYHYLWPGGDRVKCICMWFGGGVRKICGPLDIAQYFFNAQIFCCKMNDQIMGVWGQFGTGRIFKVSNRWRAKIFAKNVFNAHSHLFSMPTL